MRTVNSQKFPNHQYKHPTTIGATCPGLYTPPKGEIIELRFPQHGKIRSRKVVTRSKALPTGKYPSWKMNRMIEWESPHELNAFRLLDTNPTIQAFHEQPLVIRYLLEDEALSHTPDLHVVTEYGEELWEVKSTSYAGSPEVERRTALLSEKLPAFGYQYRLVIGEDLARQPRLDNSLTILRYGRRPISLTTREQLRWAFKAETEVIWACLAKERAAVCRLILEGVITVDLEMEITPKTRLHWCVQAQQQNGEGC